MRQSLMSSQLSEIALLQDQPSKLGHTAGHPIEVGVWFSPVELPTWPPPPHCLAMPARSLLSALAILPDAVTSRWQLVPPPHVPPGHTLFKLQGAPLFAPAEQVLPGSFPLTIASLHFCRALFSACTYFA